MQHRLIAGTGAHIIEHRCVYFNLGAREQTHVSRGAAAHTRSSECTTHPRSAPVFAPCKTRAITATLEVGIESVEAQAQTGLGVLCALVWQTKRRAERARNAAIAARHAETARPVRDQRVIYLAHAGKKVFFVHLSHSLKCRDSRIRPMNDIIISLQLGQSFIPEANGKRFRAHQMDTSFHRKMSGSDHFESAMYYNRVAVMTGM